MKSACEEAPELMSPCFFPIFSATPRWMRIGKGWLGLKNKEVKTKQSDHQLRMECPVSAFSPLVWSQFSTLDCQPDPNSSLIFCSLLAWKLSWGAKTFWATLVRWNSIKWRWILRHSMLVHITTTPRRNDLLDTRCQVADPAPQLVFILMGYQHTPHVAISCTLHILHLVGQIYPAASFDISKMLQKR